MVTEEDKGKPTKEDAGVRKETSLEARDSFAEVSTPGSRDQFELERDPSMLNTFLETCMKLLRDNRAVKGLQELINRCAGSSEPRLIRKLGKHASRTRQEMRLTTQIGDYETDQIILDLGSDANVLPKQTWERMGKPTLQWSPIQLRMGNQQKILPMGRLQGTMVDIEGASTRIDFEVIEIMDESKPYPALLGIDWATDMNGVINLKKRKMIFEKKSLRIVIPLDPLKDHITLNPCVIKEVMMN